jgi:hypothetical protein
VDVDGASGDGRTASAPGCGSARARFISKPFRHFLDRRIDDELEDERCEDAARPIGRGDTAL